MTSTGEAIYLTDRCHARVVLLSLGHDYFISGNEAYQRHSIPKNTNVLPQNRILSATWVSRRCFSERQSNRQSTSLRDWKIAKINALSVSFSLSLFFFVRRLSWKSRMRFLKFLRYRIFSISRSKIQYYCDFVYPFNFCFVLEYFEHLCLDNNDFYVCDFIRYMSKIISSWQQMWLIWRQESFQNRFDMEGVSEEGKCQDLIAQLLKNYVACFSHLHYYVALCCSEVGVKSVASHTRRWTVFIVSDDLWAGRWSRCEINPKSVESVSQAGHASSFSKSTFSSKLRVTRGHPMYIGETRKRQREREKDILPLTFPFRYALHSRDRKSCNGFYTTWS